MMHFLLVIGESLIIKRELFEIDKINYTYVDK